MARNVIIPISPKTLKPYKRMPKQWQKVMYALYSANTGQVTPLQKHPQPFFKIDLTSLNQQLKKTGTSSFIAYEQPTQRYKRDRRGKLVTSKKGARTHEIRLTGKPRQAAQRTVLFKAGQKRYLDKGYVGKKYRVKIDTKNMMIVTPEQSKVHEITMQGKTIKESLEKVVLFLSRKNIMNLHKHRIFYNFFVRIYKDGELVAVIPADGSYATQLGTKTLRSKKYQAFRSIVERYIEQMDADSPPTIYTQQLNNIVNMYSEMSRAIRLSIATAGFRVTSLKDLEDFQDDTDSDLFRIGKSDIPVEDLTYVGPDSGYTVVLNFSFEVV